MTTTFHIEPYELDIDFLQKIKSVFGEKKLIITVQEDEDPTAQLLSTESNRAKFKKSIEEMNNGNIVTVTLDELRK